MVRRLLAVRRGLTLIELVVVLAILAAVTMIVVPRLETLQGNANHAVGAASASDTVRYLQMFRTSGKQRMPDGWDSLMNGSDMWNAANPGTKTKGLHGQIPSGKLLATTLTTTDVMSLNSAGIYTIYNVDTSLTSARPSDMFTLSSTLADSTPVAQINPNTSSGIKIINHIYRANLKDGAAATGTVPTGKKLIVFGLGAQNELVGKLMLEAPLYPNVDHSLIYGRNLVVFEVDGANGSRATFKAVLGADGDLLDDLTTYMSRDL